MEIEGIKLEDKHKGLRVIYAGPPEEKGVISSWNNTYVFVDYGTGSQATSSSDLTWASAPSALYKEIDGKLSLNTTYHE